ncbi:protein kinase domain-containing protein (plasmid) [Agrobacterium vitis]|uniref:serine/threonine-protein kinase n=1 Tax=Agrobacterium vitis TaxID=373 RepID=UPI003D2A12F2
MNPVLPSADPASAAIRQVREALCDGRWRDAVALPLTAQDDRLKRAQLMLRYGLNEAVQADIDALRSAGCRSADLMLVEALQALLSYGSPETAAETANRVLSLKSDDERRRCRALLLRAVAVHRLDRWETALRDLVAVLDIARGLNDVDLRVDALKAMAAVETWRGRHGQALLHLTLAIADCVRLGDRLMLSDLLGDCGRVNLEMRRQAYALDFFDKQEEVAAGWLEGRARLRLDLDKARALTGLRRHEVAAPLLASLVERAAKSGLPYITLMANQCQAQIHLQAGNPDACLALVQPLLLELEPGRYEHSALQMLAAEASLLLGDGSAKARYLDVVELYHTKRLVVPEVEARLRLANILADQGKAEEASRILQVALARCRVADLALLERKVREAIVRVDVPTGLAEEAAKRASGDFSGAEGESYVLLEKLGSGSFATVFRAYDIERDRDVAFKRFVHPKAVPADLWQTYEQSARAEIRTAARLRHPGVARVLAIGNEADGSFYTVQDFIAGSTLRMAMKTIRQPRQICLTIRDLASTIAAMHEAGITHRDIKPDNIICRPLAKPVILDLGIASLSGAPDVVMGRGTPGYAAPEQWAGETAGPPADIFSLGVVLYEWLLGRLPQEPKKGFFGFLSSARRITDDDARFFLAQGLKDLAELLDSMISMDAKRRPSAAEIDNILGHLLKNLPDDIPLPPSYT